MLMLEEIVVLPEDAAQAGPEEVTVQIHDVLDLIPSDGEVAIGQDSGTYYLEIRRRSG
jgi:hypothetical protein